MTRNTIRSRLLPAVLACGLAAALPGCGGDSRAYAPGAYEARRALDASLAAWQKGAKPGDLESSTPPVHAVDSQWQAGQALAGYQILADEPAVGDASRRFSVTLKLAKAGETSTHYVVVGRDPIWVYRESDYARFMNMDNNPRPDTRKRRSGL